MVLYPSGLRERSAKPSFIGSNPIGTFILTLSCNGNSKRNRQLGHTECRFSVFKPLVLQCHETQLRFFSVTSFVIWMLVWLLIWRTVLNRWETVLQTVPLYILILRVAVLSYTVCSYKELICWMDHSGNLVHNGNMIPSSVALTILPGIQQKYVSGISFLLICHFYVFRSTAM